MRVEGIARFVPSLNIGRPAQIENESKEAKQKIKGKENNLCVLSSSKNQSGLSHPCISLFVLSSSAWDKFEAHRMKLQSLIEGWSLYLARVKSGLSGLSDFYLGGRVR